MQDNSGGLDAETFSYGSGRSGGRVRAGRPPDGPKRPQYRIGHDDRAGTRRHDNTSTRRIDTGAHGDGTGARRDDIGARRDDISTCNHGTRSPGADDDPKRPTDEEDDGEDDAAAGNR